MRSRSIVSALSVVAMLTVGAVATRGDSAPVRQWAVTYLATPTLIGSTIVKGPVMFVHDNARMARGEPCTTVQLIDPIQGPGEEIAAFHCIPTPRPVVHKFTIRTQPNMELGYGCILTEYQFSGDAEGHGVPLTADAH